MLLLGQIGLLLLPSLFSLLSGNTQYRGDGSEWDESYIMAQAFKKAGTLFQVFDNDTVDVLVPYGEGVKIIADLSRLGIQPNASDLSALLERAKPYTISLYENQKKQLGTDGLYDVGGILILRPGYYDENTGLTLKQG